MDRMLKCKDLGLKRIYYPLFEDMDNELELVDAAFKILSKVGKPVHFLARGTSMSMLAGILTYKLRCAGFNAVITIIRKEDERAHDNSAGFGAPLISLNSNECYCIVDDLISSGSSVTACLDAIDPVYLNSKKIDYVIVGNMFDYDVLPSNAAYIEACVNEVLAGKVFN